MDTASFVTAGGRITPAMAAAIIALSPDAMLRAPVFSMLMKKEAAVSVQPLVEWKGWGIATRRTQINNGGAAYTNATTTLVVDSSAPFQKNCVIFCVATGERMLCTAVNSGTQITVVRGLGSAVAAAAGSVADDAVLANVGMAAGEGADSYPERVVNDQNFSNIWQAFRETTKLTGRLLRTQTLTTHPEEEQRKRKLEIMLDHIEHSIKFGTFDNSGKVDADGNVVTTMRGFHEICVTNRFNAGALPSGLITRVWLEDTVLAQMGNYRGSQRRYMLAGQTAFAAVNRIYMPQAARNQADTRVVSHIKTIETAYGDFDLVRDNSLNSVAPGTLLIADLDDENVKLVVAGKPRNHKLAHMPDGKLQFLEKRGANGADAETGEWFFEGCVATAGEAQHGIIENIAGYSAG